MPIMELCNVAHATHSVILSPYIEGYETGGGRSDSVLPYIV